MISHTRILLLLFALAFSHNLYAQQTPARAQAPAQRAMPQDARLRTIQFESKLVGKILPYNVLLPVDYNQPSAKAKRYPVIYLLHGLSGHYDNWLAHTRLSEYAAPYEFIIVTPEGHNGWYTDSATVPADKYESYIVQELIPDVQKRFRTVEARGWRVVAGLSMGGYGALKFGLKFPETFAFAASMSGALGAPAWKPVEALPAFVKPSIIGVFGPEESPVRAANDLSALTRAVAPERIKSLPYFYLDCGTEDRLVNDNRELAALFLERKIPHEYRQLPGAHNWPYWDRQVREVLRIAAERLKLEAEGVATGAVAQP